MILVRCPGKPDRATCWCNEKKQKNYQQRPFLDVCDAKCKLPGKCTNYWNAFDLWWKAFQAANVEDDEIENKYLAESDEKIATGKMR